MEDTYFCNTFKYVMEVSCYCLALLLSKIKWIFANRTFFLKKGRSYLYLDGFFLYFRLTIILAYRQRKYYIFSPNVFSFVVHFQIISLLLFRP